MLSIPVIYVYPGLPFTQVAQETLSLMRTVRVYGTEEREFQRCVSILKKMSQHICASYSCLRDMWVTFDVDRYELWLEKLAGISLRQSAAYGLWNFSFNTLYHSTQVWHTIPLSKGIPLISPLTF